MPEPRPHANERAITLVELIVVMLITAVLMGLGVLGITSSRTTGQTVSAAATAEAYADAVDRFAREHRGRYPGAPGSADWPDDTPADVQHGPRSSVLGGTNRTYLPRVPEAMALGQLVYAPTGQKSGFTYRQLNGGTGYEFVIHVPDRADCALRGGATIGASTLRACASR